MPRSGTTWLARLLATSPGTALPGREPMNPRGRQYGLGGTLHGWAALDQLTPRQSRALKAAYAGCNPWTFSRYGRRQWAAPLPLTRVIVKDPFAMLSIPAVTAATGAVPVLIYRHPAAALVSYRRMGWKPDLEELTAVLATRRGTAVAPGGGAVVVRSASAPDDAAGMALFWNALYDLALDDLEGLDGAVVVAHEELAGGGVPAASSLFRRLGLRPVEATLAELHKENGRQGNSSGLHNLDRAPAQAASSWRQKVSGDELAAVEELTAATQDRLAARRLRLPGE